MCHLSTLVPVGFWFSLKESFTCPNLPWYHFIIAWAALLYWLGLLQIRLLSSTGMRQKPLLSWKREQDWCSDFHSVSFWVVGLTQKFWCLLDDNGVGQAIWETWTEQDGNHWTCWGMWIRLKELSEIHYNASCISKSGFHLSIESNLLWFCSTILSNQLKTLATLTSIQK